MSFSQAEKFIKLFMHRPHGVSVQRPPVYQRRFADFLTMLCGASRESFTNGEMEIPPHWQDIMARHERRAQKTAEKRRKEEQRRLSRRK